MLGRVNGSFWKGGFFLAHDGDGESKEHGGEDHNSVDPPPLRILVPLNITCGNEERKEYA